MSHLLTGLNKGQHAAVTAPDGPVIVLAGPGSGKTRVLTHRIAYLIQEKNIPPWRVLAVTFTNKAAREMRERIEAILGDDLRGLQVGTFHSTCARILRREVAENLGGYTSDFVIFDSDDQKSAVKQAMADLNIDDKRFNINNMRNGISKAKNALVTPETYRSNNYMGEMVGRIYRRYQEILVANNAMDFDDLLMNVVVLLDQAPHVAAKYQQQWQHILIDEFQDTNLTQYGIISRLVGGNNIFIVGDADQSIYKWRGADIRNLQRFRDDFPDAEQILLEQNYRSTQVILDAAKEVIKRNPNRVHKELFTTRPGGEKIMLRETYNDLEEADRVVSTVKDLMVNGYSAGDCAVMYRTNAQSRSIEEAFIRSNLPYKLVGATRFYGRREIKDVLAYMRLVHNPADEFSLARIINVPKRSIGAKTLATLRGWADQYGWQPGEALMELAGNLELQHPFTARAYKPLVAFGKLLQGWIDAKDDISVADLFDLIIEQVDFKGYLDDGTDEGRDRWANVLELRTVAVLAAERSLNEFLEEISLVSEVDNLEDEKSATTLLTLHAAKGLEFPVVFLVGLEDGILPHSRSIGSEDFEEMAEERRLFYVGLTRAKDRLFLSHAFQRMSWGRTETSTPSRFLNDLPDELIVGGSASSRRAQSKKQASTWNWNNSGGQSNSSTSGGRSNYSSQGRDGGSTYSRSSGSNKKKPQQKWGSKVETDRNRPKKKSSTYIPEAGRNLPAPNAEQAPPSGPPAGQSPSREPKSEPDFRTGDKVTHKKFGAGIVIESRLTGTDEEVTVAFTDVGIKRLAASIAKLEKVGR